ncbi:uncharacterized protein LOC123899415 [Trifolium pratense]|uniref:uncharacterized protein LOC123899415 n=1 Tax=Trifolium pratense TaxID=57577 RepID=UPI001E695D94|nr:uncharacterized protein LOC123899415 [Trifolium pratense]
MSLDPATTVTTTTATSSRPNSPFPNPNTKPLHHYASNSQQQTLSVRSPNPPFLYRFGSPSRATANHSVGGYPPPPQQPQPPLLYSHGGVRGGMNLDYLSQALPVTRPLSHVQFPHLAAAAATSSPTVKGHLKVGRSTVSDVNGHKDSSARERSRDDTLTVVRDRKVRITEDASLYALCRSWMRNGVHEESQPLQKDVTMALPKPSPASMVDTCTSNKKDDENEDEQEDEKSVEHLSTQDLLKRHIKRAKRVRAHLREERSQRIARYRSRLRLLVPPPA